MTPEALYNIGLTLLVWLSSTLCFCLVFVFIERVCDWLGVDLREIIREEFGIEDKLEK